MRANSVFLAAVILGGFGSSSALQSKEIDTPVILEPSSAWHVEYADEKCFLFRTFGNDGEAHLLSFSQGGPAGGFSLVASGPSFKRFRNRRETTVAFGDDIVEDATLPYTGESAIYGASVIYSNLSISSGATAASQTTSDNESEHAALSDGGLAKLPQIDLSLADKAVHFSLRQRKREVRFETGNLKAPMAALNACSQDLLTFWGLDLEQHKQVQRFPVWENVNDVVEEIHAQYPSKALRKGESAIFDLRVIISPVGEVVECKLDRITIADSLNSPVCKLMKDAKFKPAIDANGNPMSSFYLTKLTYRIN